MYGALPLRLQERGYPSAERNIRLDKPKPTLVRNRLRIWTELNIFAFKFPAAASLVFEVDVRVHPVRACASSSLWFFNATRNSHRNLPAEEVRRAGSRWKTSSNTNCASRKKLG